MVRELLTALLNGWQDLKVVGEATTVKEGTQICLAEKPELVVLDWALPDGRGFEVLRTISPKLPKTRWLVISSNEQEHIVREAIELGVHGFVLKRSDTMVFREAITRVLRGESYYCPRSAQLYIEAMRSEALSVASNLTSRERHVLRAFSRGENLKDFALREGIAAKTVLNLMTSIKEKLGIYEPAEIVRYAIKHGYVEEP